MTDQNLEISLRRFKVQHKQGNEGRECLHFYVYKMSMVLSKNIWKYLILMVFNQNFDITIGDLVSLWQQFKGS